MGKDGQPETATEEVVELEDTELLEARRRRLGEKLLSRGLIKKDPSPEDHAEENPAEA